MDETGKITVQNVTFDDKGKILLVHEKGKNKKPPGWGLPGGKIEHWRTQDNILESIRPYTMLESELGISKLDFNKMLAAMGGSSLDPMIYLTAVKELAEETGFFGIPEMQLDRAFNGDDHEVVVVKTNIIAGKLQKESIETDDCRFFYIHALPIGLYRSHEQRIMIALDVLGVDTPIRYVNEIRGKESMSHVSA